MRRTIWRGFILGVLLGVTGCGPAVGRAAVDLTVRVRPATPADALVYIDEELVGPLGWLQGRAVRLPVGEHRVSVVRSGYFPWDRVVVADRAPVVLEVDLQPIPD